MSYEKYYVVQLLAMHGYFNERHLAASHSSMGVYILLIVAIADLTYGYRL